MKKISLLKKLNTVKQMLSKCPYIYNFLCFYASNFCMLHKLAMTAIPTIKHIGKGKKNVKSTNCWKSLYTEHWDGSLHMLSH